jgi:RecB family endonuclease NucS
MLERLTNPNELETIAQRINELIEAHAEWFYAQGCDTTSLLALRRSELELHVAHGRLIFSCWTEKGMRSWRVHAWEWTTAKLLLEATRRAGAERTLIELIPRVPTKVINATISAARRERAVHLARLASGAAAEGIKIERVRLSRGARPHEPGRMARIQLRLERERILVTGVVTPGEAHDADAFLSSALIWFTRARERRAAHALTQKLWLIAGRKDMEALAANVAMLRVELRRVISLYEIDDEWKELKPVRCPEQAGLWSVRRERFRRPAQGEPSVWAERIISLSPDAIDIVRARHGETLRFHGLPFARVRRLMNVERVWFGVAGAPLRLLDESTAADLDKLLQQLKEHRQGQAIDHRHALYRAAPEAWLESMLRRDITQLDPGLIIAPLYAQFRPSQSINAGRGGARPIDLLALRRDGRLVVIELKVSEDREHVLQAVGYWRRVEAHRRWGHLARARLFGDALIADEPPLVYLVAPTLRFHRAFHLLAHAIDPRVPLYRFDINEDWRAGVRVMRRCDLT